MKKIRFSCLLLSLLLAVQILGAPAFATQEETSESSEETGESIEETEAIDETIPETELTTDASVSAGSRTIDAATPLVTDDDLLETAQAALLYERNTGTLLYAKNADEKMYPASLTKVMTCLIVLENLTDLDEIITVSESAIANIDLDASTANLVAGEEISVENLLYCLMVPSANDAAAVLAERVAGSQEAFVDMMNARAQELGCTGTHFMNPHGLHDDDHYSTARDMAKILLAAQELEEFRKLDSTSVYTVPATNKSEERVLYTTNFMLGNERIDQFYDERVTGGKTGFTTPAGRCLICTAEDENYSLVSVILGADYEVMEDGYTITYYGNFEETETLLELGFTGFQEVQVTMEGQVLEQFPVTEGKNDVTGGPVEEISALLPIEYEESDITWQCELLNGSLQAPVNVGDIIGVCRVWYGTVCIAQTDIEALSASEVRVLGENIFLDSDLQTEDLGNILEIAGIVFLGLVGVLAVIAIAIGIRNAVVRARRRRRRKARRRNK